MGDPSKLVLLDPILRTIKSDDLIERTKAAGETLLSGLTTLQVSEHIFSSSFLTTSKDSRRRYSLYHVQYSCAVHEALDHVAILHIKLRLCFNTLAALVPCPTSLILASKV